MKPAELATIAVRLLGLALVLYMIRPATGAVAGLVRQITVNSLGHVFGYYASRNSYLLPELATVALLGVGVYMFLSGRWFIRRITRGLGAEVEGVCPACGYDLAGLRVSRCPECGQKLPRDVASAAARSKPAS
ncbi:MAG: hypothetical protein ACF8R7_09065 [Phycisphaerales bacterium JB039]